MLLKNTLLVLYVVASIAVFFATWILHNPIAAWAFAGVATGSPVFIVPEELLSKEEK